MGPSFLGGVLPFWFGKTRVPTWHTEWTRIAWLSMSGVRGFSTHPLDSLL